MNVSELNKIKALTLINLQWTLAVRIVSKWVNQRKSELNSAWSLKIAITEY